MPRQNNNELPQIMSPFVSRITTWLCLYYSKQDNIGHFELNKQIGFSVHVQIGILMFVLLEMSVLIV